MSFRFVLILAALTVPASVALSQDTHPLSDPDSLPKVSCLGFKYSESFLKRYPKAPAACLEGRTSNGVNYAKFSAKVYLNGGGITTVNLLNVAGDTVSTFSFKAAPGQQVIVNGKPEAVSDLKPGETISFWVPEHRLEAHSQPTNTDQSWRVLPPTK